jgi:predicted membrane protein
MLHTTRATVLFWCQVALYITIMGAIVTVVLLFAFWLNTLRLDMEEDRARARAELQQHQTMLADHDRAREESHAAFMALLARQRQ